MLSLAMLLFLILFLHQTTTNTKRNALGEVLFLILFLHQTTTVSYWRFIRVMLFLILFLHQTTTRLYRSELYLCCSLFYFYIKPQLNFRRHAHIRVVPYSISTSNHNSFSFYLDFAMLFLILFLHQTTTSATLCGYFHEVTSF